MLVVQKSAAKAMGLVDYNNIVIIYPPKPKQVTASTASLMRTRVNRVDPLEAQCQVKYSVQLVLGEGNSYTTPDSAFKTSTKSMEEAVATGSFIKTLKEAAAAVGSQTLNCTTGAAKPIADKFISAVIATSSPTSKPTSKPESQNTSDLGAIIGGSMGGFAVLCIGYYFYTYCRKLRKTHVIPQNVVE